jgi:hypothetical protein
MENEQQEIFDDDIQKSKKLAKERKPRRPRIDRYETLVMRICDACREKLANWEKFNNYEAELIRVEIRHLLSIAEAGLKFERGNKRNGK